MNQRERGQSIILVAVAVAALLVFVAISVDGARAYERRRQMQNAADAAALAAAYETCRVGTAAQKLDAATRRAYDLARLNEAVEPLGIVVDLAAHTARVTTTIVSPTFFAGVIGVHELELGADATAKATCPGGRYVVWAHTDECNLALDWSANDVDVDGDVHSNRNFKMGGQENDLLGRTEYVTQAQVNKGNTVTLDQVAYDPEWPVWYNLEDFRPGGAAAVAAGSDYHYRSESMSLNTSGTSLYGLYFVEGNVNLVGNNLSGSVTIVATGAIQISGTGHSFGPFYDRLFLFSAAGWPQGNRKCADAVIDVSGSDSQYGGILFAPGGQIQYSGSGLSVLDGAIVGDSVRIDGSGGMITGGIEKYRAPRVWLIE